MSFFFFLSLIWKLKVSHFTSVAKQSLPSCFFLINVFLVNEWDDSQLTPLKVLRAVHVVTCSRQVYNISPMHERRLYVLYSSVCGES